MMASLSEPMWDQDCQMMTEQSYWKAKEKLIGQIVEVRADAVTQNQDATDEWSLRFPRFLRFRGFEPGEKL
jgi:DNA ligase 1